MKHQQWPTTHQGEEKTIPVPAHHASDIVVELRLRTKETQQIFKEAIDAHPHFCLGPTIFSPSTKVELVILEAGYDHYPTLSLIESLTQQDCRPDNFPFERSPRYGNGSKSPTNRD